MATRPTKTKTDDLAGSDLHHDLKKQLGEAGDPDHRKAKEDVVPDKELAQTISESNKDARIVDQFKEQAFKDV